MTELQIAADSYPAWKAIVWCLYPIGILVALEMFVRSINDDDDDDQGGGIMTPVYGGAAA